MKRKKYKRIKGKTFRRVARPVALATSVPHKGKEPAIRIVPSAAAVAAITGKQAMLPAAFASLLPELRGRAFTVAGLQQLAVIQRVQHQVADITRGREWKTVRGEIADELTAELGEKEAQARAQLLLRTHGFQSYATARHQEQKANADIMPWWQYVTTGDRSVRDSHAALDGKVFKADDPFWNDHYPPWDFGCRCLVIARMEDEVEQMRAEDAAMPPAERRVLEGGALDVARSGLATPRNGKPVDIRSAAPKNDPRGYSWNPEHQRMPLNEIRRRYPGTEAIEKVWATIDIGDGRTVLDWLTGKPAGGIPPPQNPATPSPAPTSTPSPATPPAPGVPPPEPVIPDNVAVIDVPAGKPVADAIRMATRDPEMKKEVGIALDAIAKVHGDGDLPLLQLTRDSRMSYAGEYTARLSRDNTNPRIRINGVNPTKALTATHEIGHFIDHQGLSPNTKERGPLSRMPKTDAAMDKLLDALRNSSSHKQIETSGLLTRSEKSYYLDSAELFARAYAQYVAVRSGDRTMISELNMRRMGGHAFTQWDDKDFKPIDTAMTELFKTRGWVK